MRVYFWCEIFIGKNFFSNGFYKEIMRAYRVLKIFEMSLTDTINWELQAEYDKAESVGIIAVLVFFFEEMNVVFMIRK